MVFYFYASEDFDKNGANLIHRKCLEYFSHIFDEIIFGISLDDISNFHLRDKVIAWMTGALKCSNVTFKVVQNTEMREVPFFYNEIANKLKQLNGFTFFAHNKGTTNDMQKETIQNWIYSMYYFNLNNVDEVATKFHSTLAMLYGTYLTNADFIQNKYHLHYSGTFFWINAQALAAYLENHHIELPQPFNRWYAEEFVGNLFSWENGDMYVSSPGNSLLYGGIRPYTNSEEGIEFMSRDEKDKENYYTFVKNIKNGRNI